MSDQREQPSLVEQLQAEALDSTVPVEDLLRKAKVVAAKLDLKAFGEWIKRELNGYYENGDDIPKYRVVQGRLHALNSMRGWVPVGSIGKEDEATRRQRITQAVSEISDLLKRSDSELTMSYGSRAISWGGAFTEHVPVQLHVDRAAFAQILDAVRNTILDWSLKLEAAGVVGLGLGFSKREKEIAHSPAVVNIGSIGSFIGAMGTVSGGANIAGRDNQPRYEIKQEDARGLLSQILEHLDSLSFAPEQRESLDIQIERVRRDLDTPHTEISRLRVGFESIKQIVKTASTGAAADIVKMGILAGIDQIDQILMHVTK
jgi:hypothetical protein